jgi:hypothetical protein
LSDEAAKPEKQRNRGVIRALLDALDRSLKTAIKISGIWESAKELLVSVFGMG